MGLQGSLTWNSPGATVPSTGASGAAPFQAIFLLSMSFAMENQMARN